MVSKVKLGKKWHTVLRDVGDDSSGKWVNGEWVAATTQEVQIYANIQPAFSMNQTRLLPEGDRDKHAIWGSSNHWVYEARSGTNPLAADVIVYNGCHWEVKATMPYGNLGQHVEFVAIKIKDSVSPRVGGEVGAI